MTVVLPMMLVLVSAASLAAGASVPLVISEIMPSNSKTARDPQGQYEDWIELHNCGTLPIDVGGMYLTDDLDRPTRWRIPVDDPAATTIAPQGYLVIWADGDVADEGLHADFKLSGAGEDVGLYAADGTTSVDCLTYPAVATDVSYGRYPDAGDSWGFFEPPSPGAENSGGYIDEVDAPQFSHDRGFYDTSFYLTIATETDDAEIYYTLDGSEPYIFGGRLPSGTVYAEPILIMNTTCIRAKAVKPGWKSSQIKTHTYIFVSDVARQSPTHVSVPK